MQCKQGGSYCIGCVVFDVGVGGGNCDGKIWLVARQEPFHKSKLTLLPKRTHFREVLWEAS